MRVLISVFVIFLCLNAPLAMARNFIAAGDGSNNTVNQRTTREVVRTLEHEVGLCLQLFEAYRFDCIMQSYNVAARRIKGSIDYLPAYEALNSVEQRVGAMVAANADPTATIRSIVSDDRSKADMRGRPAFYVLRTILASARSMTETAMEAMQNVSDLVFVDPYTMGLLVKCMSGMNCSARAH